MLTVLFLDNLTNYFSCHRYKFYISLKDLRELYFLSTESLEYKKKVEEFIQLITNLNNLGIITPSKKHNLPPDELLLEKQTLSSFYFLNVNPSKLRLVVDAIFH
jgi:hypothetical protein